jgi:GTP-binding protein
MTTLKELFRAECRFIAGAAAEWQIPVCWKPEVAFAGRSNVGKSSLLNAVVGQGNCARVSKTPGRTRQINFFELGNKISLADLPGYGFAAVSHKTRKLWDDLILNYLQKRYNLQRVFLLIDSRHGIKKNDEEIMNILDGFAVTYKIILTKIDKITESSDVTQRVEAQITHHPAAYPTITLTSAEKSIGIREVQIEILKFMNRTR